MRDAQCRARQIVAMVCLLAVLLAALSPASSVLLYAILIPLWFFVATIISTPILIADDSVGVHPCPVCRVLSPRPPPAG